MKKAIKMMTQELLTMIETYYSLFESSKRSEARQQPAKRKKPRQRRAATRRCTRNVIVLAKRTGRPAAGGEKSNKEAQWSKQKFNPGSLESVILVFVRTGWVMRAKILLD